jgi:hypothetical protein
MIQYITYNEYRPDNFWLRSRRPKSLTGFPQARISTYVSAINYRAPHKRLIKYSGDYERMLPHKTVLRSRVVIKRLRIWLQPWLLLILWLTCKILQMWTVKINTKPLKVTMLILSLNICRQFICTVGWETTWRVPPFWRPGLTCTAPEQIWPRLCGLTWYM